MTDMIDYLKWRGDIPFSCLPVNPVDALIFSTLAYISYDGLVAEDTNSFITLNEVADNFLDYPDANLRVRVKRDLELLELAAQTERFGKTRLAYYRDILIPEEETQFAAVTFFLDDGSSFLTFRGTDNTLTGWKEDFNMSFLESIPAQRLALQYVEDFAKKSTGMIRIGGHSKGGNLAVYAAAKCDPSVQLRIIEIYNQDGPGFTDNLMGYSGYQNIVPKIFTYIPQSSLIGMLLEHEEPYIIIKSKQIGVLQHDPYTWEVMGKDFIYMEEVTADSRFVDKTIKNWLENMNKVERDRFVDTIFDLLASGDADYTYEIMHPRNLLAYVKTLGSDDEMRKVLAKELVKLVHAAGRKKQKEDLP